MSNNIFEETRKEFIDQLQREINRCNQNVYCRETQEEKDDDEREIKLYQRLLDDCEDAKEFYDLEVTYYDFMHWDLQPNIVISSLFE